MTVRVLVCSTSRGLQTALCSKLSDNSEIQVTPLQSNSASINDLLEHFEKNDLGLFIVSPENGSQGSLLSEKAIFLEVGMSIMKYGLERTIMVVHQNTEIPSDVQGVSPLRYNDGIDNWMPGFVTKVENAILNQQQKIIAQQEQIIQDQVSNERYWLSLIECRPGQERLVKYRIKANADEDTSIKYLRSGVIYGEYDLFLLFKSSSTTSAAKFITHLRQSLEHNILSIDTKFVFPSNPNEDKFWINPNSEQEDDNKIHDLVLLSCYPYKVELAYQKIKQLATSQDRDRIYNCDIICVGIIFGKHDIFFLINAENVQSLDNFLYRTLIHQQHGIQDYLAKNTTSLRIRRITQE